MDSAVRTQQLRIELLRALEARAKSVCPICWQQAERLAVLAGRGEHAVDVSLEIDENLLRRLSEAEACLGRLREEADRRRWREPRTDEDRALVKLLDDVGSPLAYLVGFVEASAFPEGRWS